ncbi:MAG TPA: 2OG-Fe(II) oxygenase [Polyangiaceae bacterium]|nr:2OG-Fe(II) oxygenase [Polyangiaceae bacterium]
MNALPLFPEAPSPVATGRLARCDLGRLGAELDAVGWSLLEGLLTPEECRATAALYADEARFRSTVVMARHNFGRGEYKYFDYPLPEPVAELRPALYEALLPTARRWREALGEEATLPATHAEYRALCHAANQLRPTPLLLSYGPGDYNCLHQDLYGELVFPLQVAVLLSEPGRDFTGGEFILTEQRPRMQSRAEVVPLHQGDAVAFAVRERPMTGTRGVYRVQMRHGVSRVRTGARRVLGIIFHDAT